METQTRTESRPVTESREATRDGAPKRKSQYVRFWFLKVAPEVRCMDAVTRNAARDEFAAIVHEYADRMFVQTYSTVGMRADADLALVLATYRLEDFQEMQTRLLSTRLGQHLTTAHSFLAMTRRSIYVGRQHMHEGQEGTRMVIRPGSARYLFVYPFVKTRAWYMLPMAERQRMMNQHIELGHRYPTVRINTTYSFGLDDQEFVVAFDSDTPEDFLDLVMKMRETEASSYTLRDTPIFTCITMDIQGALAAMGA